MFDLETCRKIMIQSGSFERKLLFNNRTLKAFDKQFNRFNIKTQKHIIDIHYHPGIIYRKKRGTYDTCIEYIDNEVYIISTIDNLRRRKLDFHNKIPTEINDVDSKLYTSWYHHYNYSHFKNSCGYKYYKNSYVEPWAEFYNNSINYLKHTNAIVTYNNIKVKNRIFKEVIDLAPNYDLDKDLMSKYYKTKEFSHRTIIPMSNKQNA